MSRGAADAQSIEGKYRVVEHTADIGIELESETLSKLFAMSACAMFDLMIDLSDVRPAQKAEVALQADSPDELLVTWLNELVFRAEISGVFFSKFEVECLERGGPWKWTILPQKRFEITFIRLTAAGRCASRPGYMPMKR
jgi:SHS2 domain-containing protein